MTPARAVGAAAPPPYLKPPVRTLCAASGPPPLADTAMSLSLRFCPWVADAGPLRPALAASAATAVHGRGVEAPRPRGVLMLTRPAASESARAIRRDKSKLLARNRRGPLKPCAASRGDRDARPPAGPGSGAGSAGFRRCAALPRRRWASQASCGADGHGA